MNSLFRREISIFVIVLGVLAPLVTLAASIEAPSHNQQGFSAFEPRTPLVGAKPSDTSVNSACQECQKPSPWFIGRLFDAYAEEFSAKPVSGDGGPEPARRALPAPWDSPPYPSSEYQGSPLIGVPGSTKNYPLTRALYDGPFGETIRDSRIKAYGWVNGSYNWSTANNSNQPTSYWIVPRSVILEQAVLRFEREADTVQTNHVDVGFRFTSLYGSNYRYMTSGGWFSQQLLKGNQRYGYDSTEVYIDTYLPWIAQGLILRVGRWVATPDIEVQFAPDNYMATHSLQFTFDTYTQTGVMATLMLSKQWTVQGAVHSGTDMAPWYQGATPTGMLGVRWVARDNNDSAYVVLNNVNTAKFRHFEVNGQPAGHDNFNYVVGTWQHRFSQAVHSKITGIYMWQQDAVVGGTPIIGSMSSFGGGGSKGATLSGFSSTYGLLNYTMVQIAPRDFITVRNEWWRDERGMRSGVAGHYSTHAIGLTHQLNDIVMIRPEIGWYRCYTAPVFDQGRDKDLFLAGADMTFRF